jgi:hypothetical protein
VCFCRVGFGRIVSGVLDAAGRQECSGTKIKGVSPNFIARRGGARVLEPLAGDEPSKNLQSLNSALKMRGHRRRILETSLPLAIWRRDLGKVSDAHAALRAPTRSRLVTAASARAIGAPPVTARGAFDHVRDTVQQSLHLGG